MPAASRRWKSRRRRHRPGVAALGHVLALAAALLAATPASAEPLVRLATVGPWSAVSALVGFGPRLWFVNSVKFRNHNSADVYSYDPARGTVRYEAHLFSQDAGEPAVRDGVLFWPFEDSRWSTGRGAFMATDGRTWRWGLLPQGQVFHVHAMAVHRGALYAATSAWRAGLQRSRDGGAMWEIVHDQPTPADKVSRITSLADFAGSLYAGLITWYAEGRNLLRLEDGRLRPVESWPRGHAVLALAPWRGHLYAVNVDARGRSVWRFDGAKAERIAALDGLLVRDLAGGPDALWAVTAEKGAGALWRSPDGAAWARVQRFADAEPVDVAVYAGRVYVGAIGPGNRGSLWGPPRRPPPMDGASRSKLLARLDALLKDPAAYRRHGPRILELLRPLALAGGPAAGEALSRRLAGPFPAGRVEMFGGNAVVPIRRLARWYLLWAVAMNGHGYVDPDLIAVTVTSRRNGPEKYLEPAAAAAWAVARLGQKDEATLAALVARLGRENDPRWLEGDIVGALTALTGRRLGYDAAAWRRWWRGRGKGR